MKHKRTWGLLIIAAIVAVVSIIMIFVLPITKPSDAWYSENIEVVESRIVVKDHMVSPGGFVVCVTSHHESNGILTIEAKGIRLSPFAREAYHVEPHDSYIFDKDAVRMVRASNGLVLWENTSK